MLMDGDDDAGSDGNQQRRGRIILDEAITSVRRFVFETIATTQRSNYLAGQPRSSDVAWIESNIESTDSKKRKMLLLKPLSQNLDPALTSRVLTSRLDLPP